jgi:hypothetical protein
LRIADTFLIRKEFVMKKELLESGARRLSCGLALVVFAFALALGACDIIESPKGDAADAATGASAPSGDAALPDDDPAFTEPDADGKVLVRVKVPADTSRSLSASDAKRYANYYEVVFADRSTTLPVYYSDAAPSGETLNVRVPVGHSYDILFLAGYDSNKRILLGSDFLNTKRYDGTAGYLADGLGYPIEAGKANVISVEINAVTITPKTEYAFEWVGDYAAFTTDPELKVSDDLTILTDKVGPALEAASEAIEDTIATLSSATSNISDNLLAALAELLAIVDPITDGIDTGTDSLAGVALGKDNLHDAVTALGDDATDGYIKTAIDDIAAITLPASIATATDAIGDLAKIQPRPRLMPRRPWLTPPSVISRA